MDGGQRLQAEVQKQSDALTCMPPGEAGCDPTCRSPYS